MINISIAQRRGTKAHDLTEEEVVAIELLRRFKTREDKLLALDIFRHIIAMQGIMQDIN